MCLSKSLLPVLPLLLQCFVSCGRWAEGIRITELKIPSHGRKEDRINLTCTYELGSDRLYQVKWYKDDLEFFRFDPNLVPKEQVFPAPGIHVDVGASGQQRVILKNVNPRSTGTYRCEVIGEAPVFKTAMAEADLLIVEFPEEGPRITGIKPYYHWGDLVRVNCTTRRSKPVASLAWYINGKQAERELVQEFFPFTDQTGLETAVLGLSFRLASPDRLSDDVIQAYPRIVLKCTASIANVYWEQAEADVKIRAESRASLPSSRAQDASSVAEGNGKGSPGHSLSPVFVSLLLFDFYFRC